MKKMEKLKKGKVIMIITVGLSCFILSTVMFMQFKLVNQTDITSIETMRKAELTSELAAWKQKYEDAETRYNEVEKKLNEYKEGSQSTEKSEEILKDELEQINLIMGKTDVEGEGIVITLKNSENSDLVIKADDLLVIVNSLKLAGAEAISINEQRIINTTDIVYINNSFIKVNQQRILAPYIIKAIGNQSYLESELVGNGGHVDELKKLGYDVSIEKNNKVKIKKYEGEISTKYIE